MIHQRHQTKVDSTSMLMISVSLINIIMLKKQKKVLFEKFSSLCEWFTDNKLSIHFGADKTEAIKNS